DAHAAGDHDPRVDAAQVELAARGRVHEPQRVASEALRELGAAGVRFGRDLDDRGAERKPRAGRQVLTAEVEIDVELVAGESPTVTTGDQVGGPGVHQGELPVRLGAPVARAATPAHAPVVTDQAFDEVELRSVDHFARSGVGAADDELDSAFVA